MNIHKNCVMNIHMNKMLEVQGVHSTKLSPTPYPPMPHPHPHKILNTGKASTPDCMTPMTWYTWIKQVSSYIYQAREIDIK